MLVVPDQWRQQAGGSPALNNDIIQHFRIGFKCQEQMLAAVQFSKYHCISETYPSYGLSITIMKTIKPIKCHSKSKSATTFIHKHHYKHNLSLLIQYHCWPLLQIREDERSLIVQNMVLVKKLMHVLGSRCKTPKCDDVVIASLGLKSNFHQVERWKTKCDCTGQHELATVCVKYWEGIGLKTVFPAASLRKPHWRGERRGWFSYQDNVLMDLWNKTKFETL